ncbi:MAG: hypothetical protein PHD48_01895 [Alphaproteobacteria bacterium]|nr:hypothetical protein [Alphaproteobacteria bacterium]
MTNEVFETTIKNHVLDAAKKAILAEDYKVLSSTADDLHKLAL